jgi:hypothetical protein
MQFDKIQHHVTASSYRNGTGDAAAGAQQAIRGPEATDVIKLVLPTILPF